MKKTTADALALFTGSSAELREYVGKHKKVFDDFERLENEKITASNALKMAVREEQTNIATDHVKVTYSPAFRKWYDAEVLINKATPKVKKLLQATCISQAVDKPAFEQLVERGEVPVELQQAAFKEEPMAPRVIIKEINDAKEKSDK